MKLTLLTTLAIACLAPALQAAENCTAPADATFKKVSAKPDSVLEVVAADVAASPKCACPIVKAAISATQADDNLQGDIVAAAINAAPDEAAAIKGCLPAKATGKGGKSVAGKGKVTVPTQPDQAGAEDPAEDSWFDPLIYGAGGMGVGGVAASGAYASSPGGGGSFGATGLDLNPEEVIEVVETGDGDGPIIVVRPSTK